MVIRLTGPVLSSLASPRRLSLAPTISTEHPNWSSRDDLLLTAGPFACGREVNSQFTRLGRNSSPVDKACVVLPGSGLWAAKTLLPRSRATLLLPPLLYQDRSIEMTERNVINVNESGEPASSAFWN
jgi:hypothetical protein